MNQRKKNEFIQKEIKKLTKKTRMNYFAALWFSMLFGIGYLIFYLYTQVETLQLSTFFETNHWVEKVWIFPFYILSELCYFVLNKYGESKDSKLIYTDEMRELSLENVAVIIPCHNAMEEIKRNCTLMKKKFKYIFIADNDSQPHGNVAFEEFCAANDLYYVHHSIPNKTNAILQTARYVKKTFPFLDKVVLLDDDTIIHDSFFIRDDLLKNPTTAGYTCTIGINKSSTFSILEHWIDFEYRTISYRNRSRNFHSLKFLHGIICVYRMDALLSIYPWNVCNEYGLPFGEDAFGGLQARNMGYVMKQDHQNTVYTFCPRLLINLQSVRHQGYGASSLWKQRVNRWYLSWPRRLFNEFGLLFFYDTGSWMGNVLYRLDFIWYIWILSIASWWIGILIEMSISYNNFIKFSYLHLFFYGMNIITSYLRLGSMAKGEREKIAWFVPLTFPFFLLILMFFYSFSFLLSIFYYIPFYRIDYKKTYRHVQ